MSCRRVSDCASCVNWNARCNVRSSVALLAASSLVLLTPPPRIAEKRGVGSCADAAVTSQLLAARSTRNARNCPRSAARCSGVQPSATRTAFTSAPRAMMHSTSSECPARAAMWSGAPKRSSPLELRGRFTSICAPIASAAQLSASALNSATLQPWCAAISISAGLTSTSARAFWAKQYLRRGEGRWCVSYERGRERDKERERGGARRDVTRLTAQATPN